MKPQIPWLRVFVEGVVIVGSILLAFGIDAWWEERQERAEEEDIILGLRDEFLGHRAVLTDRLEYHRQMVIATEAMLAAAEQRRWDERHGSLDAALDLFTAPPTTDLGRGELEALISAGRLGLVSDRDLRLKLITWEGVFEEVRDDETVNSEFALGELYPFLTSRGIPLGGVMRAAEGAWPVEPRSLDADPAFSSILWADPEFYSLVEQRLGFLMHTTVELEEALDALGGILAMIDANLR